MSTVRTISVAKDEILCHEYKNVRGTSTSGGDGVSQWVERRPQDPMDSMTRGSNPVRNTRKMCEFFGVKHVVLTRCRCSPIPLCIYTHAQE